MLTFTPPQKTSRLGTTVLLCTVLLLLGNVLAAAEPQETSPSSVTRHKFPEEHLLSFSSSDEMKTFFSLNVNEANKEKTSAVRITDRFKNGLISAHRGGARKNFPENCLSTFEDTLQKMPAMFEIDPRLTKDGVIVLMHDETINRTTTGSGRVKDFTYEELQQFRLKDGDGNSTSFTIPTLREVILWAKGKTVLVIDRKDVPLEMTEQLIREMNAETWCIVIVYNFEEAAWYYARNPNIMMEAFFTKMESVARFASGTVPWENVIPFVGVDPPPPELYGALHEKGRPCMIGCTRAIDRSVRTSLDASIYHELVRAGALIVETDLPLQAHGAMYMPQAKSPTKPNIVVILSDDMGWADIGWHGKEIRTPSLDRLAEQGVRLEQFYVQPLCTPTRASLMTGRYPMRYGLQTGVIMYQDQYGLSPDERTLPHALREVGYYTAICGKWHLGHAKPEFHPLQCGFDYQYGLYFGQTDYYTHKRGDIADWRRNGQLVTEEGYSTELIASEAVKIIQNHDGDQKPLFLYVPFNAVHSPYQSPPQTNDGADLYPSLTGIRKTYAAMIHSMDTQIGRILDAVEKKGIKDNTFVFFFNDNGGPQPQKITNNGDLRAGKGTLYEGGVRVSACAVFPPKIKPGTVSNEMIHITDMYPTLLTLAGASLEQKRPLDGVNLLPTLFEGTPTTRTEILHNITATGGALRMGNWKIIANGRPQQVELFDIANDPNEKNNLADTNPEKRNELAQRLDMFAKQAAPSLKKESAGSAEDIAADIVSMASFD